MKILLEQKEYIEITIEYPYYAHLQDEYKDIYVKITATDCIQITKNPFSFEVQKLKNPGYLALVWYHNKGTKEQFDKALKEAKQFINKI